MAITIEYKDLELNLPRYTDLILEGVFAAPDVESNDLSFSNRNGMIAGVDRTRGRRLSLSGNIVAFNESDFNDAVMEFRRAFEVGIPAERELILTMPGLADGIEVSISCRPRRFAGPINIDYDNWSASFQVDLFATDPSFYSPVLASNTATLTTDTTPGGHGFPLAFPHGFGGGGSSLTIVHNAGNAYVWPRFIIFGPLVNPSLINQSAAATISFEIELGVSDVLYVDSLLRTVTLNGANGASRFNTLRDSEWWQLVTGNNSILFDVESTSGSPHVTLSWRDGWL